MSKTAGLKRGRGRCATEISWARSINRSTIEISTPRATLEGLPTSLRWERLTKRITIVQYPTNLRRGQKKTTVAKVSYAHQTRSRSEMDEMTARRSPLLGVRVRCSLVIKLFHRAISLSFITETLLLLAS
jgi:hypothetical protein